MMYTGASVWNLEPTRHILICFFFIVGSCDGLSDIAGGRWLYESIRSWNLVITVWDVALCSLTEVFHPDDELKV